MLHTLRFFPPYSKCRLFHNATFFGTCVTHILYTECAKIKKNPAPKGYPLAPDLNELGVTRILWLMEGSVLFPTGSHFV